MLDDISNQNYQSKIIDIFKNQPERVSYNLIEVSDFQITQDSIKIDGIRVGVSYKTLAVIADILNLEIITTRMLDLAFSSSNIKLTPQTQPFSSTIDASIKYSQSVDKAFIDWLTANPEIKFDNQFIPTGKMWGLPRNNKPFNYGFHVQGSLVRNNMWRGIRCYPDSCGNFVLNPVLYGHNDAHHDYSQTIILGKV